MHRYNYSFLGAVWRKALTVPATIPTSVFTHIAVRMARQAAKLSGAFQATVSATGETQLSLVPGALATKERSKKRERQAWATYKSQALKKLRAEAERHGRDEEWVASELGEVVTDKKTQISKRKDLLGSLKIQCNSAPVTNVFVSVRWSASTASAMVGRGQGAANVPC